jgi:AbrB family looped-hinge helix DNA binding protein
MAEIVSSVTSKGQVTLPADVRRRLGIGVPGKIAFVLEPDGTVTLRPVRLTLESVKGSVPALPNETADLKAEIADAFEAHVEKKFRTRRR